MKYQFEYKLTEHEFIEYNEFLFFNSSENKKSIYIYRWGLFWTFMVLSAITAFAGRFAYSFTLAVVSVVIFFVFNPFYKSRIKNEVQKLKKKDKSPFPENISIQFDEDLIFYAAYEMETKIKYTAIEKSTIDNNRIYLCKGEMDAIFIPFSAFESESQRQEFLEFINGKIGEAKE